MKVEVAGKQPYSIVSNGLNQRSSIPNFTCCVTTYVGRADLSEGSGQAGSYTVL